MNIKHFLYVLCGLLSLSTLNAYHKYHYKQPICKNEEDCINTENCQCYCSVKCGFRKKDMSSDRPVYVENDPNGIGCYCKQWDLDHYKKRHCPAKDPHTYRTTKHHAYKPKHTTQKQHNPSHKSSHKMTQWHTEEYSN